MKVVVDNVEILDITLGLYGNVFLYIPVNNNQFKK